MDFLRHLTRHDEASARPWHIACEGYGFRGASYAIEPVSALDNVPYPIERPEALYGAVALAEAMVRRVYGRR